MKAFQDAEGNLVLELGKRERHLFLRILDLYPVVPVSYARLSTDKDSQNLAANQQLLEESLRDYQTENRKYLQDLFHRCGSMEESRTALSLKLPPPDFERLLQVLNDIRIGSWLALGAPEGKASVLDPQTAPHVWAMEIAGFFQVSLLSAIEKS